MISVPAVSGKGEDGVGSRSRGVLCYRRIDHAREADADLRAAVTEVQRDFPSYAYGRVERQLRDDGPHHANHGASSA